MKGRPDLGQALATPELRRRNERFSSSNYVFGKSQKERRLVGRVGPRCSLVRLFAGRGGKARSLAERPRSETEGRACRRCHLAMGAGALERGGRHFHQFAGPALRERSSPASSGRLRLAACFCCRPIRPNNCATARAGRRAPRTCTRQTCCAPVLRVQDLRLEEHDSHTREGRVHVAIAALVDLVARKPR